MIMPLPDGDIYKQKATSSESAKKHILAWCESVRGYINSKEQLTGIPLSGSEAVLSTMLGVQKDEIAAHYSRKNATSTLNRIKSEARTEAARLMDLAKTAVKTGDFEQAKEYHKRALIHASTGGLTRTQWNNLMKDKDQYQDVNKAYDRAIMRNKQFELRKQQAAHMGEQ